MNCGPGATGHGIVGWLRFEWRQPAARDFLANGPDQARLSKGRAGSSYPRLL